MAITEWRRIDDFRTDNGYPGRSAAVIAPIWEWERLTPLDREGAMTELNDWVNNVLCARYRLGTQVPACWQEHPDLVSILVWFHETAPDLRDRDAEHRGSTTDEDWEREVRACAQQWPAHCRQHQMPPLGNPRPLTSSAKNDHLPRLLLLDHCLRTLDATTSLHLDDHTAQEIDNVLRRAGITLGAIRGRRKAELRLEISDLVLDLARETLAQ